MLYNVGMKVGMILVVAASFAFAVSVANAEEISEAAKIGANAGAMKFCRDNIASEDDQNKYVLAATKTTKQYGDLSSEDRVKALAFRKAAEDGEYLGDPLDEKRCDSIRKLLYLKD